MTAISMESESYYRAPDKELWLGRKDSESNERFFQIVQLLTPQSMPTLEMQQHIPPVAVLGFASDEGIYRNQGRIGASFGPLALRKALGNYPLSGQTLKNFQMMDVGDIVCANNDLENAQAILGETVEQVLEKGALPIVLGGGHETSFGHYLGLHKRFGQRNLGIVNFDAHFDMRPLIKNKLGTSGSPFLQIAQLRKAQQLPFHYYCFGIKDTSNTAALFKTAEEWRVKYVRCDDVQADQSSMDKMIEQVIAQHDVIYLSLCLDVFSASVAPGVSAASPYGLEPYQVLRGLRQFAQSGKVVAIDIVELAPNLDRDNITAKLAAMCVAEFLYYWRSNCT